MGFAFEVFRLAWLALGQTTAPGNYMAIESIAWAIAVGGWTVALLQCFLGYRERRVQREDELLAQTLGYFDGGAQRRSIGLALVEGIWIRRKRQLDVIVPVLVNQFVYLLLSSESKNVAHEERNLVRLSLLVERCMPLTLNADEHRPEILDAILRKCCGGSNRGVNVSAITLKHWFKRLGGDIEMLEAEMLGTEQAPGLANGP